MEESWYAWKLLKYMYDEDSGQLLFVPYIQYYYESVTELLTVLLYKSELFQVLCIIFDKNSNLYWK